MRLHFPSYQGTILGIVYPHGDPSTGAAGKGGDGRRWEVSTKRTAVPPIPGIEQTPGVCGGDPCIRKTRIPVWLLESFRRLGSTEAELLDSYPSLQAQDLVNAWAYVRTLRDEIERQILENESA